MWTFVLLIVALVGARIGWEVWLRIRAERVEAARSTRVTAEIDVAPAAATGPTLIGPAGTDAAGYPLRYVDRPLLRSLLWHARYPDLNRRIEELQRAFEKDWHAEDWVWDAVEALAAPELAVREKLDAWVAADDRSFVPLLVRGLYEVNLGYAQRGTAFIDRTAREDLRAMGETLTRADQDLERAVSIEPSLVFARRGQMRAALAIGDTERLRRAYDLAVEQCPLCFGPRVSYILALRPRWGGSHEEMLRFAQGERDRGNPRFRLLAGYVDLDRSEELLAKSPDAGVASLQEALATADRACAVGEHWPFLLRRGRLRRRSDPAAGLRDLDRAAAVKPGQPEVLFVRAEALGAASRFADAGRDLLAAMRVNPVDPDARRLRSYLVKGLLYEAGQHARAGRRTEALDALTLAEELDPRNTDVQGKRAAIVSARSDSGQVSLATLKQRTEASPDDLRALQEYDYALARQGRYPEVIELWTGYLRRHPDNARAHLERGGAFFNMGRRNEAGADAQRACELGLNEGCARARQLGLARER